MSQEKKTEQSAKLAADVEAFVADGGEIVQATFEDTRMYREIIKKGKAPRRTIEEARDDMKRNFQLTSKSHTRMLGDGGAAMRRGIQRDVRGR